MSKEHDGLQSKFMNALVVKMVLELDELSDRDFILYFKDIL